jgi:photosystem II stability/assembly factor-like uncharacterized protein
VLIGIALVAVIGTGGRYLGPSLAAAVSRPAATTAATPAAPTRLIAGASFIDARHGSVTMAGATEPAQLGGEPAYLTSDGGRTWTPAVRAGRGRLAQIVYLDRHLVEQIVQDGLRATYQLSVDGGRTWRTLADPRSPTTSGTGIPPVFLDANDGLWLDRVNFLNAQSTFGPVRLWRTRDGGRTWVEQALPSLPARSQPISADLADAEHELVVERDDRGSWALFVTADGGATWRRARQLDPLNPDERTHNAFVGSIGGELVATLQVLTPVATIASPSASLYLSHSDDGGLTWSRLVAGPAMTRGVPVTDGSGRLVLLDNRRLWSSSDLGVTWTARVVQMPADVPPAFLIGGTRDASLFALASQPGVQTPPGPQPSRLLRSTDGGAHWDEVALPKT